MAALPVWRRILRVGEDSQAGIPGSPLARGCRAASADPSGRVTSKDGHARELPRSTGARALEAVLTRQREDLTSFEASKHAAQSGAPHEEDQAAPEGHARDGGAVRGARLAERSETLRDAVAPLANLALPRIDPEGGVVVTALVTLEDDDTGEASHYFLVPAGRGERLEVEEVVIQTLTPVSPLGRRLTGLEVGDEVVLQRPRGSLHAMVEALR